MVHYGLPFKEAELKNKNLKSASAGMSVPLRSTTIPAVSNQSFSGILLLIFGGILLVIFYKSHQFISQLINNT